MLQQIAIRQIAKGILCALLTASLGLSMLLVAKKHTTLACEHIDIQIKEYPEQTFITSKTVLDLLQITYKIPLIGHPIKNINAHCIKHKLATQPLIKKVVVYKSWPATLHIFLETKQLLARILIPECPNDGRKLYLDENGSVITLEGLPLCRLLIVSGNAEHVIKAGIAIHNKDLIAIHNKDLTEIHDKGLWAIHDKGLLALLHQLHKDRFFRYQITSLQLVPNHTITLGTQVGNQQILFGKAENIHEKLEKLKLFYKEIIPYKGWHAYRQVNLAFSNQLICS